MNSKNLKEYSAYQDVKNVCLENRNWEKEECTVEDSKVAFWNYTNNSDYLAKGIMSLSSGISGLVNFLPNKNGAKEQSLILSSMKSYLSEHSLNSCQKACMVKCVASTVLSYSDNNKSKYGGIKNAYSEREGVCTEFSSIAKDLGYHLNIPIRFAGGYNASTLGGHGYNSFFIDGNWYYGEPQNSECRFYHTIKTLDWYKDQAEGESQYDGGRLEIIEKQNSPRRRSRPSSSRPNKIQSE